MKIMYSTIIIDIVAILTISSWIKVFQRQRRYIKIIIVMIIISILSVIIAETTVKHSSIFHNNISYTVLHTISSQFLPRVL